MKYTITTIYAKAEPDTRECEDTDLAATVDMLRASGGSVHVTPQSDSSGGSSDLAKAVTDARFAASQAISAASSASNSASIAAGHASDAKASADAAKAPTA